MSTTEDIPKLTKASVTAFLYCGDEYLFLKRRHDASINAGELNGIGGKVEDLEDFISAVIRETEEETGYKISEDDIDFCGNIKFDKGYKDKWITCFFKVKVPNKDTPLGNKIREGDLIWLRKDEVFNSGYKLVDDINYIFDEIVAGEKIFFMSVETDKISGKINRETMKKRTVNLLFRITPGTGC